MIAWLWKIIVGEFCKHQWEAEERIKVFGECTKIPVAHKYVLKCKKCGNMKKFKT